MSAEANVLNQQEIDALLHGVKSGAVEVEGATAVEGEVQACDLARQARVVRGRMPTLETINDRFMRFLQTGIYGMFRRTPQISLAPIKVRKLSDYLQTLDVPTSLNLIRLNPLRGSALCVLDARLVYAMVDNFFGGSGRQAKVDGRDFTLTESRIIQLVLRQVLRDLQEAWSPVLALQAEFVNTETNPQFASVGAPGETMVVTSFRIELDGAGGDLQIVMPYAMLEPIRELLDIGLQGEPPARDGRWAERLRAEIEDVEVELVPVLARTTMTLEKLLNIKAGDVIPCDFDGQITLIAEGIPALRGAYCVSRGQQAIQIKERLLGTSAANGRAARKANR